MADNDKQFTSLVVLEEFLDQEGKEFDIESLGSKLTSKILFIIQQKDLDFVFVTKGARSTGYFLEIEGLKEFMEKSFYPEQKELRKDRLFIMRINRLISENIAKKELLFIGRYSQVSPKVA